MTKNLRRAAALGAAVWMVSAPAGPALTQVACVGGSQTFTPSVGGGSRTDAAQPYEWVTPAGVNSVTIRAAGARAGNGSSGGSGGLGAQVEATYPVTPGERLCIVAGVAGRDWDNVFPTGGGGGSFVFSAGGGPCLLSNASTTNLLVAAGGGGANSPFTPGLPGRATGLGAGPAGALAGGASGGVSGLGGGAGAGGGGGGLLTGGGTGGNGNGGFALIVGGAGGGPRTIDASDGGFGGGGSGGGGGGYNGGGGAGTSPGMPGGGGGSFSSVVPTSATDGVHGDNGEVTVCAVPPEPVPTLSEWAMIGLAGVLAMFGLALLERRRRFVA